MGKDGNELKYQFQTLYISIHFHLSEPGECGHIQETARAALRVAMCTTGWYLQDLLFPPTGRCCILEDEILLRQQSTLLSILVYHIFILLFNLMLCCTDK